MKTLTTTYLAATAAVFAYVGGICSFKRRAPAAGTLGLIIVAIGLVLTAWTGTMVRRQPTPGSKSHAV